VMAYDQDGILLRIEVYAGVAERVDLSHLVTKGFSSRRYGGRSETSIGYSGPGLRSMQHALAG
jgi:hypothetical protein